MYDPGGVLQLCPRPGGCDSLQRSPVPCDGWERGTSVPIWPPGRTWSPCKPLRGDRRGGMSNHTRAAPKGVREASGGLLRHARRLEGAENRADLGSGGGWGRPDPIGSMIHDFGWRSPGGGATPHLDWRDWGEPAYIRVTLDIKILARI